MNKNENAAKMGFAREAEKTEKAVLGVFNGEKCGVAAAAVGKCSREEAQELCDIFAGLIKKFPKGKFFCEGDGKGKVRFDLYGDAGFVAEALKEISAKGTFGEDM